MNFPALENVTLARTMLDVVTLTLNRADRCNALSLAMLKQLHTAWNALAAATDPWVMIMCSALPRVFVAGSDIAAMRALSLDDGVHSV